MKIKRRQLFLLIAAAVSIFVLSFSYAPTVHALEPLEGKLDISYSPSTGKLTAVYDGDQSLSGGAVYTWYKDGSTVGNGFTYAPSTAGSYYCILKDNNSYDGTLTSGTITLYRATGTNINFDNQYGLYEGGDTVTVTATLNDSQYVSNWKTSATGVTIPQTGQSVSFRMPAQNITVTCSIKTEFDIKVYGGTADKYKASTGETVTITASSVDGKKFVSWSTTGGKLGDPKAETTTLTVANSNIVATANFQGETTSTPTNNNGNNSGKADALNTVYTVLNNQGYNVQMYHHTQGPLCEAAFRYAQSYDWLVTDYFNLTVNNSFSTYEIPSPLKIQLTIPDDLIKSGRNWRMVCVSRNGNIYSFPDEDMSDSTITFSPDKFYAYAMCYNDIVPSTEEEIPVEVEPVKEPVEVTPTSQVHSASESKTTASAIHSADASATTNTTGVATAAAGAGAKLKSNQSSAVERANGASVSLISM